MPSGEYRITHIPEDKVEQVEAIFKLDEPKKIKREKQADNLWTVIATFEGEGEDVKKYDG